MLDLKTGRFVINEEKGWEFHPFMSREEFMKSDLFQSDYLNKSNISVSDKVFLIGSIDIDGYNMSINVVMGGLHDCVKRIRLTSTKIKELADLNSMPSNWREIATEVKRIHDEFLQKETTIELANFDSDKDNNFHTSWGSVRSDFSLSHDMPSVEIVISYDNITDEDREQLKNIPLW